MGSKLEEYKSKLPEITGSSTINHAARVKLGLTCSEYCTIDYIARKNEKREPITDDDIYVHLGITASEYNAVMPNLVLKGYIRIDDYKYVLTSKWAEGFADVEKEFDNLFWRKDGKVAWTGTRKKALEYWIKIRKKHSLDFMVRQRDRYFEFLDLQKKFRGFDQQRVMCQVFLNPANERYLEDYADYVEQLKKKYVPPETKKVTLTREDVLNAYAKDNNKQGGI